MNNNTVILGEIYTLEYEQVNINFCNFYCGNYVELACEHNELPTNAYSNFWSHIELGAGNYGKEGHSKTSQQMTVLMEFSYVSDAPNYIDNLEVYSTLAAPAHQYALLFQTLDQLVLEKGPKGIFHVNDLYKEYADYAMDCLKEYALSKNYHDIIIEVVPGDYTKISSQITLKEYRKLFYDSAHLKNPEVSFYNYGMDGWNILSDERSRLAARTKLQKLADLSQAGLDFFPIDVKNKFIPQAEQEEFITQGKFYHTNQRYNAVSYYFPEGDIFPETYGIVSWIAPSYKCS
jgi:hypothetical protein